jgi:signal transduction histidine kinase
VTREDAHQLRHPLAVILLWEQIARGSESPATRKAALDAIRQAALEQSAIIDRMAPRKHKSRRAAQVTARSARTAPSR